MQRGTKRVGTREAWVALMKNAGCHARESDAPTHSQPGATAPCRSRPSPAGQRQLRAGRLEPQPCRLPQHPTHTHTIPRAPRGSVGVRFPSNRTVISCLQSHKSAPLRLTSKNYFCATLRSARKVSLSVRGHATNQPFNVTTPISTNTRDSDDLDEGFYAHLE